VVCADADADADADDGELSLYPRHHSSRCLTALRVSRVIGIARF